MRRRGERGASAVEYALLIVAVAVALVAAVMALQQVTAAGFAATACDTDQGYSCQRS